MFFFHSRCFASATTARTSARMSVPSTLHFSSGIRANNFVNSLGKIGVCIQMYIITSIPNSWVSYCVYLMLHVLRAQKPITNKTTKWVHWLDFFGKNTAHTQGEEEKWNNKKINPLPFAMHLPSARVYYFYEFFVPFAGSFFSPFFWLRTNLIWGWNVLRAGWEWR